MILPDLTPSSLPPSGFAGADAPVEADLYRCVHCGLCLSACPTYIQLGVETESPRGRLALMKAVNEGRTPITDRIASHWDLCLQCRACEAVCPSGVPYGRIMEQTRAQVLDQGMRSDNMKTISRWFLRAALPHPGRLRFRRPPAPGVPTLGIAVAGPAIRSAPVVAGSAGPLRVADSGPGRPLLRPI